MKKTIKKVVAGIIIKDKLIFCAKRNNNGECGGKWEFPGGKIEIGETKEEALIRELKEELDCLVKIEKYVGCINYEYETFILRMHLYTCSLISDHIKLNVHQEFKWLPRKDLKELDWASADLKIIDELIN